jgi:sec-independent protein translocase protein TatB
MNPLSSVGTGELIFILVIALIFLGPQRLPEIARNVGKAIRQFRDVLQGMSSEFGEELASVQEVTRDIQDGIQAVHEVRDLPKTLVSTAAEPLVEAMAPVKTAVKEAKEGVDATLAQAKKTIASPETPEAAPAPVAVQAEGVTPAEGKESTTGSKEEKDENSFSSDEP